MIWTLPALYTVSYVQRSGGVVSYTTVTADTTSHTKGAWTEIVPAAAYSFDVGMVVVRIQNVSASATNTAMLIDIGVGAASSEQVLLPNILAGGNGSSPYWFPIFVPGGTRISARCQAAVAGGDTASVNVDLYGGPGVASHPLVYYAAENCGADTATSDGVTLTVGSWVQLKSATDYDAVAAVPMFAVGGTVAGANNTINVGIGASSSEQVLIDKVKISTNTSEAVSDATPTGLLPMDFRIPAGTRVAMNRDEGDRSLTGALMLMR